MILQDQIVSQDQLEKKFDTNENILELISNKYEDFLISSINKLGIIAPPKAHFYFNNQQFQIGESGIFEIGDIEIPFQGASLYLKEDSEDLIIIDYVLVVM